MVRSILLLGDLGSGVNLIKNILLTDEKYKAPFNKKIFDSLYLNHDKNQLHKTWLEEEYKTRRWKHYFGFDPSNGVPENFNELVNTLNCSTIFVNHSCFFSEKDRELLSKAENVDIIACIPVSDLGIQWQVRAYVEKKGIRSLHNFSFAENIEVEKKNYIKNFGLETYLKFNVLNFYEAVKYNRDIIKNFCFTNKFKIFNTEELYQGNFQNLKKFSNLDYKTSSHLFEKWEKLHWSVDKTYDWQYAYSRIKS